MNVRLQLSQSERLETKQGSVCLLATPESTWRGKRGKMRRARNSRVIAGGESVIAAAVFQGSLPPWRRISIADGLGAEDRPYTFFLGGGFTINVGPDYYPDLMQTPYRRALLIHELTHVWQYYHGYTVIAGSFWANTIGMGYDYTIEESDSWADFNVEQQAHIVEDWYAQAMSRTDDRFVFIEKIIWPGISSVSSTGYLRNITGDILLPRDIQGGKDLIDTVLDVVPDVLKKTPSEKLLERSSPIHLPLKKLRVYKGS